MIYIHCSIFFMTRFENYLLPSSHDLQYIQNMGRNSRKPDRHKENHPTILNAYPKYLTLS